ALVERLRGREKRVAEAVQVEGPVLVAPDLLRVVPPRVDEAIVLEDPPARLQPSIRGVVVIGTCGGRGSREVLRHGAAAPGVQAEAAQVAIGDVQVGPLVRRREDAELTVEVAVERLTRLRRRPETGRRKEPPRGRRPARQAEDDQRRGNGPHPRFPPVSTATSRYSTSDHGRGAKTYRDRPGGSRGIGSSSATPAPCRQSGERKSRPAASACRMASASGPMRKSIGTAKSTGRSSSQRSPKHQEARAVMESVASRGRRARRSASSARQKARSRNVASKSRWTSRPVAPPATARRAPPAAIRPP